MPPLPYFGLTPEVARTLHVPGSGAWIDQPWRPLAFGFLYFAGVGIYELYGHAWLKIQVPATAGAPARQ